MNSEMYEMLRRVGQALVDVAEQMMNEQAPATPAVAPAAETAPAANETKAEAAPEAVPETPAPAITKADLKKLMTEKAHTGFSSEAKALLTKYGAASISKVKDEDIAAMYAEAEAIGHA